MLYLIIGLRGRSAGEQNLVFCLVAWSTLTPSWTKSILYISLWLCKLEKINAFRRWQLFKCVYNHIEVIRTRPHLTYSSTQTFRRYRT